MGRGQRVTAVSTIKMVSPWEEAKELVSCIVRETTAENHHPPRFHWLGDHTKLSAGLKELEWMPHVSLVEELVQLADVFAKTNPNTQEMMLCLASQMELFYISTHAQLESLCYYCSTTLRTHMNEQLLLAVNKSYIQLVLAVIGCIRTMKSLQIALGSLPDILQMAYVRDIPNKTIFSIEDYLDNDNDMNDSSDDTDVEMNDDLNDRSASFQSNSGHNSSIQESRSTSFQGNNSHNSSLQEARAGFLRLVVGEESTNDQPGSTANIEPRNSSGSLTTEEFLWSLGEQEENEQKSQIKESSSMNSSAVTSLLVDTPKSNPRSSTNKKFGNVNIRKQQQQKQQQQQQKQQAQVQQRPSYLDIPRTIAQHPLLPHRLHTLFEDSKSTVKIKRPWESPKNNNSDPNDGDVKKYEITENINMSQTSKERISIQDTLKSEMSSDVSKMKMNVRKKRPRNNLHEDGPMHSAKRSRTSLEANASKMQKRFLSMVDQIVSSNFVENLENASIDNEKRLNSNKECFEVDAVDTINRDNLKSDSHSLNIADRKTATTEASPKNITGQMNIDSIRPKAGFYKEIDEVYNTLEKDVNTILSEKKSPGSKIISKDENKESDICKTERVPKGSLSEKKSKRARGRPRKVKK